MPYDIFKSKTLGNREKCWYCGIGGFSMTKDHFLPKFYGGRLTVRCCHNCNGIKGCKTPAQWVHWIEQSQHPEKERMLRATVSLGRKCVMNGRRIFNDEFIRYLEPPTNYSDRLS